ncbi:MAG: peptidoglycan D,D-transpeptidase FtsI family protein [Actinomycetota bacterium]
MARRGTRPTLRLVALLGIFTVLFAAVAVRLVMLQVVRAAPLETLGARQRISTVELPAQRGAIFDRNMTPLAVSTDARAIYADTRLITDPASVAAQIAPILGIDAKTLAARLGRPAGFVYLARKVRPDVADRVLALRIPYIGALDETARTYPADAVAGQVLGFVSIDNAGLAGLELKYNDLLSGTAGKQVIEHDPQGRPIPQGHNSIVEPVPGKGLETTIDSDIQFFAEQALANGAAATGAKNGTAVVLDPRSGDVLAMANWPALNPNAFGDATPDQMRNRIVTDAYEPGSVNKVITASAAIEAGIASPSDVLTVPYRLHVFGKTFSDFEVHPTQRITYAQAIAESSNIGTIEVALKVGKRRIADMLDRYGYGRPTGVGFPGESAGVMLPYDKWYTTSLATIPIGQGIAVTPLQMAMVYGTIANDGVQVQPRLIRGIVEPDGTVTAAPPSHVRRIVSPFVAAQVRGMLTGVVEDGTGTRAQIPGYLVAGKTGTARVPNENSRGYSNDLITTFVGMAPADDARLVVLVQLYDPSPRIAAVTAAPVFQKIMQYSLAHLGVQPTAPLPGGPSLASMRARAMPSPSPTPTASPSPTPSEPARKPKKQAGNP